MKNYIFGILLTGVFMSCQKKDTPSLSSQVYLEKPVLSNFSGMFYTDLRILIQNDEEICNEQAQAYFVPNPFVGDVNLNGQKLAYYTIDKFYTSEADLQGDRCLWAVQGANGIPAFTHNDAPNIPSYKSITGIPEKISKSKGFTLIIKDLVNVTRANAFAYTEDSIFSSKIVLAGTNELVFTPQDLSPGSISKSSYIQIGLENTTDLTFSGKNFRFVNRKTIYKQVEFTP